MVLPEFSIVSNILGPRPNSNSKHAGCWIQILHGYTLVEVPSLAGGTREWESAVGLGLMGLGTTEEPGPGQL